MATTTATIFVGHSHLNDGGINPTHFIQLTENSRPALILRSIDGTEEPRVMTPTLENMIDDVYLMIATYVLKSVKPNKDIANAKGESMYDLYNKEERKALYNDTLNALQQSHFKVVFNILNDSHLLNQLDHINRYPADVEITTPFLTKEYSSWTGEVTVTEFKK